MTQREEIRLKVWLTIMVVELTVLVAIVMYSIVSLLKTPSYVQMRSQQVTEVSDEIVMVIEEGCQNMDNLKIPDDTKDFSKVGIKFFNSSYYFSNIIIADYYYNPTENERQWLYLMTFAEAGNQGAFGQTLVANVIINRALLKNSDIITICLEGGQFSCIHNGVPSIYVKSTDEWIPVTEDMITDELKQAVDTAFEKDYTEELLREVAEAKGLGEEYYKGGALYFYNPKGIDEEQSSSRANIKVKFSHKAHGFYRVWDR